MLFDGIVRLTGAVAVTPIYLRYELTFNLGDYRRKESITARFSGGDTPSAGTG